MDAMTIPDVWSGQDRALTAADMENMPDDEFRYELDDGVLIVSPAPSTLHQLAVSRLTVLLSAACPDGLVVLPGVGVNISKFQHRVPDVAVVRATALESFSIPAYWIVEPSRDRPELTVFELCSGSYEQASSSWLAERCVDGYLADEPGCLSDRAVGRGEQTGLEREVVPHARPPGVS